jgi:hypothetical protein
MKIHLFLLFVILSSCSQPNKEKQFPDHIGIYKLNSVVDGDSAINAINVLHHLAVAADKNSIIRYGENSEDILYISKFADKSTASEEYDKMYTKMKENKKSPFSYLVPMKKYENSYMTIGMGLVHYIYQSSEYLIWFSTKQKFYNELPLELIKNYPPNQ